jgi:hypothetical protein
MNLLMVPTHRGTTRSAGSAGTFVFDRRVQRSPAPDGVRIDIQLSVAQFERAAGVLLAVACGDTLGAPQDFGRDVPVTMTGGGPFGRVPGDWTAATTKSLAEVSAHGLDLFARQAQDQIVARWSGWALGAKEVGNQTSSVLAAARQDPAWLRHDAPAATGQDQPKPCFGAAVERRG